MSMPATHSSPPLFAFALLALLARPAMAAWPADPTVNVPLSVREGFQGYPKATPDGSGGAIVAWHDTRGGSADIYIQRVDASGTPRWTADGVAICTATGEQYEPELVSDGSGGAIVTWVDWRGAAYDIYVQRIDSTGTPLWTADGVPLCTAAGFQSGIGIIPDGSGGAIVTWDDPRVGNNRIYAQRVNAGGVPQWTANGVLLTNSVAGQARPVIVSSGAGGAIVAWEDYRNFEADIFAQRILPTGAVDPAWPPGGRAVALLAGEQAPNAMVSDGNGGAILTWAQWNGGTRDIYVQHLLASGGPDPAWPATGRRLFTDYLDQSSPALVADGAGGVVVSWSDQRGTGRDIYAHHVLASGALDPAWPDSGRALSAGATGDQDLPEMVPDGAGGAIVFWMDPRNNVGDSDHDIYAQHVLSTGTVDPVWPASGRAICTAPYRQALLSPVADGTGGAIIAWYDNRANAGPYGDDGDVYAQRVGGDGQLGEAPVGVADDGRHDFALEPPSPNPSRSGAMLVRFALPDDADASLELFDVGGRRIARREVGALGAGQHAVDLTSGRRPGTGVYFVRLEQGGSTRVQRVVVLDE